MPTPYSLIVFLFATLAKPKNVLSFVTPSSSSSLTTTSKSTLAFATQRSHHHHQNTLSHHYTTNTIQYMSSSSSSIDGKHLLSIQECLSLHSSSSDDDSDATIFLDGSWHLDKSRNGREEYETGPRIENAKYFDIDDISSKGEELNPKGLPHMMPPKKLFEAAMDALDIKNTNRIIVYGTQGATMFTARTWYTLTSMGHNPSRVHLMQGSLQQWMDAGGPIEEGEKKVPFIAEELDLSKETTYTARDSANFVDINDVLKVVNDDNNSGKDTVIIDTRGAARFNAEAPEPRPGVRGGHMPGAINVPFSDLLDSNDNTKLKSKGELQQVFENAGVKVGDEETNKIICSCGSGVLACLVAAALEECGRSKEGTFVYDGSWTEWGLDPDTPIVK